jgi:hypothetical protein
VVCLDLCKFTIWGWYDRSLWGEFFTKSVRLVHHCVHFSECGSLLICVANIFVSVPPCAAPQYCAFWNFQVYFCWNHSAIINCNDVVHDAVHRLCQGIPYFEYSLPFYVAHVNLISFTPIRNVRRSVNSQMARSVMCWYVVPNAVQIGQKMWKVLIEIRLRPLLETYVLHGADFQETNSHSVSSVEIFHTECYPKGTRSMEHKAKVYLHPEINHGFHCTGFRETCCYSMALRGDILCQLSPRIGQEVWNVGTEVSLRRSTMYG